MRGGRGVGAGGAGGGEGGEGAGGGSGTVWHPAASSANAAATKPRREASAVGSDLIAAILGGAGRFFMPLEH